MPQYSAHPKDVGCASSYLE